MQCTGRGVSAKLQVPMFATVSSFVMNLYLNIPMSTGYFVWSSAYVAAFNASWSHCNGWHRPYWALACTCISICFRSVQRKSRAFLLFFLPCRQSGHPWYPLPATMLLCFMEAAPWLNRFIVACHHLNRFLLSFWVELLCFSRCALFACTQTIWCF